MTIDEGTGNVFADLGFANPEEQRAKAQVSIIIEQIIDKNGWTQTEAARRMGLSQPDVSDIVRGRLKRFTLDRLFQCLNSLGQDIEITVRPSKREKAQVFVAAY